MSEVKEIRQAYSEPQSGLEQCYKFIKCDDLNNKDLKGGFTVWIRTQKDEPQKGETRKVRIQKDEPQKEIYQASFLQYSGVGFVVLAKDSINIKKQLLNDGKHTSSKDYFDDLYGLFELFEGEISDESKKIFIGMLSIDNVKKELLNPQYKETLLTRKQLEKARMEEIATKYDSLHIQDDATSGYGGKN